MREKNRFKCRRGSVKGCPNEIIRENLGDLFDYPFCESCQREQEDKITRLNDGLFYKNKEFFHGR